MEIRGLWRQIGMILLKIYEEPKDVAIQTLSMLIMGLLLGGSVQLPAMAVWVPLEIQLTSIVRRFERFFSDPELDIRRYFAPFVIAMYVTLGSQIAYLIIDCTKAGSGCRTVLIGLHGSQYSFTSSLANSER